MAITCEDSDELTGLLQGGGILAQLSDYQFLKK
jgi:hypothetical protein